MTRRERLLAFITGVLLCSVLSTSLTVVFRNHDSLLSGTRSQISDSPPFPHRARTHSESIGVAFWPWARFHRAAAGKTKDSTTTPAWGAALWPWRKVSRQESNATALQKAGLPVSPLSGQSTAEAREKKAGEKAGKSSQGFLHWPWIRSRGDDGDETAEKSATKLAEGNLTHEVQTEPSKPGFRFWHWGGSSSPELPADASKLTKAAVRPVAVKAGSDTPTVAFEMPRPSSTDAVSARDRNAGGGSTAGQGGVSSSVTLTRAGGKSLEESSGVGRFEWIWNLTRMFRIGTESSSSMGSSGKRADSGAAAKRHVKSVVVEEALPTTQEASVAAGSNGGPIGNSYLVHVSADSTSHGRSDGSPGEGTLWMILTCVMGTVACAMTAVGTVGVLRARRGEAEGDELPLVMRDLEDWDGCCQDNKDIHRAARKEGKKDGEQGAVGILHEEGGNACSSGDCGRNREGRCVRDYA